MISEIKTPLMWRIVLTCRSMGVQKLGKYKVVEAELDVRPSVRVESRQERS